jgi:pimeloyl-ACP methyl ester carboxylesterase
VGSWIQTERDGVRLACLDFGGTGTPVLMLHGLAGHAREWAQTAQWLTERARVLALDARGHGRSERTPKDVSRAAHIGDVVFVIERLDLAPVVLVGQSLGGLTALLVAAERPDLVRALVVADAGPARGDHTTVDELQKALAGWPVPFASREAAVEFFGGPSLAAEMWAQGLELRHDGWWPAFDLEVMTRTLREATGRSYWEQWEAIQRPTLLVRAGKGDVPRAEAEAMAGRLRQARVVELDQAEHDLRALSEFLDALDPRPGS